MEFGGTDTRNITCGISPLDTVQEVKDKEHPSVLVFGGWSDVGQGHLSSSVLSFTATTLSAHTTHRVAVDHVVVVVVVVMLGVRFILVSSK